MRALLPAALAALFLPPAAGAQAPAFQGLGTLPGGVASQAEGVSADGTGVVGFSDGGGGGTEAFHWTAGGGMQGLGFLPGGIVSSASGVSADGAVVVGTGTADGAVPNAAFRWTAAGGMQGLGHLPNSFSSAATDVSADGGAVVGASTIVTDGMDRAFRWTAAGGMQDLGVLSAGSASVATGVSADGSVVVGGSAGRAFRWTAGTGMVSLGSLPGGAFSSAADVSADGAVVVGVGVGSNGLNEAFRWTQAGGMVGLGRLPGATASQAFAVSADGAVVVGRSEGRAFVWTAAEGMRDLRAVLVGAGLDLTGWTLTTATGVSSGGSVVIVGYGTNSQGQTEAWRAALGGAVAVEGRPRPSAAVLHAPTPNPSGTAAVLRYDVATAGPVRLSAYDALSREVAAVVDGRRAAGRHEAVLDVGRLAPGVYVVRLTAAGGVATRRLTVAR